MCFFLFFFNDTATTEIYTLSLHDALPIYALRREIFETTLGGLEAPTIVPVVDHHGRPVYSRSSPERARSEEHTSELQSRSDLVCRLLLEKKKHSTTRRSRPRTRD